MADQDDLDAEFALFEKSIASVVSSKPSLQTTTNATPTLFIAASSAERNEGQPPLKRPRFNNSTLPSNPQLIQSPQYSSKSPQVSAAASRTNDHASHANPATGKWKWTGSAWKWVVASTADKPTNTSTAQASGVVTLQSAQSTVKIDQATTVENHLPSQKDRHTANGLKRAAAGRVWKDNTMTQWPENDHRIFVGDLAPDATEKDLETAFGKYPSYNMSRVVCDKRTGLCRGYGFVSFADGIDMVKALKEMNGKYVGSRPVKLKKSKWKKRNLDGEREAEVRMMKQLARK